MSYYVDGRADALLGTHTHVQTNDAQMLKNGTLYLSDLGMVGAKDSVIGVDKDIIIDKFVNNGKTAFSIPKTGKCIISGAYLELHKHCSKKNKIELINEQTLV